MPAARLPANEDQRLDALRRMDVLDSAPEPGFDELTAIAASVCQAPIALVTLVDEKRQWFKSTFGLCMSQTPRNLAFCAHTLLVDGPLVIPDATQDVRTSDNALVTGEPHVRFYAGIPLRTVEGFLLGTLCVIDMKPRTLSPEQLATLSTLAKQVVRQLEQRKEARFRERAAAAMESTGFRIGRPAIAALLVGFVIAGAVLYNSYRTTRAFATQRFKRLSDRVAEEVGRRATLPVYALNGLRGLYAANGTVTRKQFDAYVASCDLATEFRGVRGIGFLERLPVHEGDRTNDSIVPGSDSYVLRHLFPSDPTADAWEKKLLSTPDVRAAMDSAIRTGQATSSRTIRLAGTSHPSYLYIVPIYRDDADPQTPAARLAELSGVAVAPVSVDTALNGTVDALEGLMAFQVLDSGGSVSLYDSGNDATARLRSDNSTFALHLDLPIVVGGRTWVVRTSPTHTFDVSVDQHATLFAGLGGTLLSVLVALVAWSFGRSRARALAVAKNITADLNAEKNRAEVIAEELRSKSAALQLQNERIDLALGSGGLGAWEWNIQTGACLFDKRWLAIIGGDGDITQIHQWTQRVHLDDIAAANAALLDHFDRKAPIYECTQRLQHRDGSWRWTRTRGVVVARDERQAPLRMIGISEDITRDRLAKEAISRANDLIRRTGDMAHVGGWELDMETQDLSWTDEVYRIHELPVGSPITLEKSLAFYPSNSREQINAAIDRAVVTGEPWDIEVTMVTATGKQIWVRTQGECQFEGGRPRRVQGAFQDITQRKNTEDQLRSSATHDKLTGLPNRALLHDRLQQCILRQSRSPDRRFALLFLDFDRFKLINDMLGHDAGDALLQQIAARLRDSLRPADSVGSPDNYSTISRLGGDEFVVILDEIASPAHATLVAERLLSCLSEPYLLSGHEAISTASIGIVASDARYSSADDMLRDADIAMYEAKTTGKGRCVLFDASMHARVQQRVVLESDLRTALAHHEFCLHYQPIVSLDTGETQSVEALIRWNHPRNGLVMPAGFIPVAEEIGLIIPMGEWALRTACEQFMEWRGTLGTRAPASISVNISRHQLALHDLPATVRDLLRQLQMPPEALHLEITESTVMKDPELARHSLQALRDIGVKVHLDDFGTGYSSLASLQQFPIDAIKLDRAFTSNVADGRHYSAIVQSLVQLADNLSMMVIIEGIETVEQLAALQCMGCQLGQGYIFSKPLPPAALAAYLLRHEPAATLSA